LFKCPSKFSSIYGLFVIVFTLGFFAVSPTDTYRLLSGLFLILLFFAYQYRKTNYSYVLAVCLLLVHHILLVAVQKYQSITVDVMTPFIINSGFIYAPLLPNPFHSIALLATLSIHFCTYKGDEDFWLVLVKIIGTILCGLLSGAVIQFLRNLTIERDRFYKSSITDSLTGVYTFTYIIQSGQKFIKDGHKLTAVLIDLDNYKNINDTYGHFIGNKVLSQFADVLCSVFGPEALIGRMGGDEFIVLLRTNNDSKLIDGILDEMKYRSYVTDPDLVPIHVAFSYGIVVQNDNESGTIEQLLTIADKNMFNNKISTRIRQINCEIDDDIPEQFSDLLNVLSQKDMYTFIHSLYVARFSKELGEIISLSPAAVDNITLAGWLHDIGKIAIPNEILRKPAQLNDEEYQSIKRHVDYGLSLLRSFDINGDVIHAIAEHHERYDGTGYPRGKSKEEISVEGRILAIADAYSAMTIKRVYRSHHLSAIEALRELEKGKGYQFDPVLVERFVSMITARAKSAG